MAAATSRTRHDADSDKENAMDIEGDLNDERGEGALARKLADVTGRDITGREDYDPDQDKNEKRWLRKEYRSLIAETEEKRQEYLRSDSDGLSQTIGRANELVQQVKNPYEATLDSRLLVLASDLGVQKARLMKLDHNAFDPDDYVSKLITFMGGRQMDDDDENSELNWNAVGALAKQFSDRVPTTDFILGPLSVEQKQRKQIKSQTRLVKDKEEMRRPEELKEGDLVRQENETTRNVKQIADILELKTPVNFFEFVINPHSYGQTIENLFYMSFLIRDGKACIEEENGQPMLGRCEQPTQEDYDSGLTKKQLVIDIDMRTWKELIDVYNIKTPMIPTREKTVQVSGKWYG